MQALRLAIELVPETSWENNMRNLMGQTQWDKLRRQVYLENNMHCAICDAEEVTLNCHEVWEYNDKTHVQRLVGFTALCNMCHAVKHIGKTQALAEQNRFDLEAVIRHFMSVNACNRQAYDQHHTEAFDLWRNRSKYDWSVDFGKYGSLVRVTG